METLPHRQLKSWNGTKYTEDIYTRLRCTTVMLIANRTTWNVKDLTEPSYFFLKEDKAKTKTKTKLLVGCVQVPMSPFSFRFWEPPTTAVGLADYWCAGGQLTVKVFLFLFFEIVSYKGSSLAWKSLWSSGWSQTWSNPPLEIIYSYT